MRSKLWGEMVPDVGRTSPVTIFIRIERDNYEAGAATVNGLTVTPSTRKACVW